MPRICDRSDCPAIALHDIILHGQDFYFCAHHWAELNPAVRAGQLAWDRATPPLAEERSSASRGGRSRFRRRRSDVVER